MNSEIREYCERTDEMIQKNLKLISLTTVLAGLLFFSTPLNANADEKKDTTSDEAIMKKALLVINGFEEDGKTKIPTGQARVEYLKAQDYDPQKVQDKVNEILLGEVEVANVTTNTTSQTTAPTASTNTANTQAQSTTTYTGTSSSAKEWIAQKESGGSYTAQNGRYYGRYQLDSSYLNGDYSPANQERVADNYVANRYGSWENAQQFWLTHGWY